MLYYAGNKWTLQATGVCYGAKGNSFGSFRLRQNGFLIGLKLEHTSGSVTCDVNKASYSSHWGCGAYGRNKLGTVITDDANVRIYPANPYWVYKPQFWYHIPGYKENSKTVVFGGGCSSMYAQKGQQLRIWYGEDLGNSGYHDNGGRHCVNVYAMFK